MKQFFTTVMAAMLALSAHAADYSGTLPVIFINTENSAPIVSKEDYIHATYYLDPMGVEGVEAIGSADAPLGMQIRGRGNYSWSGFDKKPYRIKLDDKQPLLGMDKSKHFALLAHADDNYGFMRNIVGFELSRMIGMPWTPADAPCEVVLNGDYIGLYFLTETIRVDKNRVNIVEQPDMATAPEDITGGWLVEIDNYDSDPHITLYEHDADHSKIIFTYKTPEELSQPQTDYLTSQMSAINDAVYDLESDSWEDYVDVTTLARYYLVQEIVDDYESFHGSCYIYKDRGDGKWYFGPVWDFGNAFSYDKSQFIYQGRQWHNTWIEPICEHQHFIDVVAGIWQQFYAGDFNDIYTYIDNYASRIAAASLCDYRRWPQYGNGNLAERVEKVKGRLRGAASWLQRHWGAKSTYTATFIDNGTPAWDEVHAYMWAVVDGKVKIYNGDWPGDEIVCDETTGSWHLTLVTSEALPDNTMIIFNNGHSKEDNQTADLEFVNGGTYNRDGLMGIKDASCDTAVPVYYNLQGIEIPAPEAGNIYIVRRGASVTRELYR